MAKTVMILGAYGLIGSACTRAFLAQGHRVIGVGRSIAATRHLPDSVQWMIRDLAQMDQADWARDLQGVDAVVNCAGALQDGLRDSLSAIHADMPTRLAAALKGRDTLLVQVSAAGVSPVAPTEFMRSKAKGDAAIMRSAPHWVILRPTLVLSPAAYGGTALLRASAALPFAHFRALSGARVQTVHVDDVVGAVVMAVNGALPNGLMADLTERGVHDFDDLQRRMRAWLGLPEWRNAIRVPAWMLGVTARIADGLGWLGWRSPLRSTALESLRAGVVGDATTWPGPPCRSLTQTLNDLPSTQQERWFARLYLLLPLSIGVLSLFWLLSGIIGLVQAGTASEVLTARGFTANWATGFVLMGGIVDIALGLGLLIRRFARRAALGTIAVSLVYLIGAAVFAPDLWLDPLGPMVKVLPGIALSAIVALLVSDR